MRVLPSRQGYQIGLSWGQAMMGGGRLSVPPCCIAHAQGARGLHLMVRDIIKAGCEEYFFCRPAGISSTGQSTLTLLDLSPGYLTKQTNGSFIGVSLPRSFMQQLCLSKQSNASHSENQYSFILKKLEMYFVVVLGLLSHPVNNTDFFFSLKNYLISELP